jgi:hypothetical protein
MTGFSIGNYYSKKHQTAGGWTVISLRHLAMFISVVLFLAACGGGGDDSGTSGGSGETETTANSDNTGSDNTVDSSTDVWLDAFAFNCTDNWTQRDGALGLVAYSGSGSCVQSFPGESGTYRLELLAVTEYDGESPYRVSINGTTISEGTYPLSTPLGCNCPIDQWRTVCPDLNRDIDLGTHQLETGDSIEFWGDDTYPCGQHGSFAKWLGIRATRQ